MPRRLAVYKRSNYSFNTLFFKALSISYLKTVLHKPTIFTRPTRQRRILKIASNGHVLVERKVRNDYFMTLKELIILSENPPMNRKSLIGMIKAILQLTRPINTLITFLSVFVAAFISGPLEPLNTVILACLSAGFIMAAGNTINDYYDIDIDLINKPQRPLPSGKISKEAAWRAAVGEFLIGNIIAAFISAPMLFIAFSFSMLIYLYAARLKGMALWGNIAVSLTTAAAFTYGGMAVGQPQEAIIPALFAFFFHFGREIIKDMEDVEGDRRGNASTFPIRYGFAPAIKLIWANFLILIGLTILPYAMSWYGKIYFIIVITGVHTVLLFVLFSIRKNTEPEHLGFLSNLLKADMVVGLLAIYFR